MILNGYAILDGFVTLLRLGLSLLIFWIACFAWQSWRRLSDAPQTRQALENRSYLLFQPAYNSVYGVLLGSLQTTLNSLNSERREALRMLVEIPLALLNLFAVLILIACWSF